MEIVFKGGTHSAKDGVVAFGLTGDPRNRVACAGVDSDVDSEWRRIWNGELFRNGGAARDGSEEHDDGCGDGEFHRVSLKLPEAMLREC